MPLADRLAQFEPNRKNSGCCTCKWLKTITEKDRAAFEDWIAQGHSLQQLYNICIDDPDNPYPVSLSALRNHVRDCKK